MMLNFQLGLHKPAESIEENEQDLVCCKSSQPRAVLDWLVAFIKPKYFAELRTKQQNGYVVFTQEKYIQHIQYLSFLIQSNIKAPNGLISSTYDFLQGELYEKLKNCDQETFNNITEGIISEYKEKYKDGYKYFNMAVHHIDSRTFEYNSRQNKIHELQNLKLQDCLDVYEKFVLVGGQERRVFEIVQISQERVQEEKQLFEQRKEQVKVLSNFDELEKSAFGK